MTFNEGQNSNGQRLSQETINTHIGRRLLGLSMASLAGVAKLKF